MLDYPTSTNNSLQYTCIHKTTIIATTFVDRQSKYTKMKNHCTVILEAVLSDHALLQVDCGGGMYNVQKTTFKGLT